MLIVLGIAAILVITTNAIHLAGLVGLSAVMRRQRFHPAHLETKIGQGMSIIVYVLSIFLLHAVEIWVYTAAFLWVNAFDNVYEALYYSISSFTTVGFGDVLPDHPWRMLGATESANGFLLIGWSTAFLVSISSKIRMFEASLEREGPAPQSLSTAAESEN
ncbi:potassium channel family protein [Henriciella mobilis]|uniref:Two pore domain potassium channel family protein n=1 Tax=Henriciella mobilis TaxID=2305467 RepID=A0A399R8Z1_9PROT|nr:potassium channel family protein [Henriciella mobilis]RIJ27144.1 two pore domain potassium channel family protein [Henriciella mobilis]